MTDSSQPHQVLKHYFGYDQFRPHQLAIINSVLSHHDTLALMATGGGKSICFQIPGLILAGTTLVVSPLISLMKDQVDRLQSLGIAAARFDSSLPAEQLRFQLTQLADNQLKFVYVSPERLHSSRFIASCQPTKLSLIAIDEAHCISQWGHDFRPEYRLINQFVNQLSARPKLAAFTATATPQVRDDIVNSLDLIQPQVFTSTFVRSNLRFHSQLCQTHFNHELALRRLINRHRHQPGIIYTATQKKAVYLFQLCQSSFHHLPVAVYHAGLPSQQRMQIQEQFIASQLQLIIATNAFGMGVDKADVRWVVHFHPPGNIENYYQEAGRAGRDQQPADCYLLFNPQDLTIQHQFISQSTASQDIKDHQLAQLHQLTTYATQSTCRQEFISRYFGEAKPVPCQQCDVCTHQSLTADVDERNKQRLVEEAVLTLAHRHHCHPWQIATPQLIKLIALHQPQAASEYLRLPGLGYGWVEKWYNKLSRQLEKGFDHEHDHTTTNS